MIRLVLDSYGQAPGVLREHSRTEAGCRQSAGAGDGLEGALHRRRGLDLAAFQPVEPQWNSLPAGEATRGLAWTNAPSDPCGLKPPHCSGRLWYSFSVIEEWTGQDRGGCSRLRPPGMRCGFLHLAFVVLAVLPGAARVVARHNLKQNRGDRRGAWRLAIRLCLPSNGALDGAGPLHGLPRSLRAASCWGPLHCHLLTSVVIWTVYLALEPPVRRRWPQSLISWSTPGSVS